MAILQTVKDIWCVSNGKDDPIRTIK